MDYKEFLPKSKMVVVGDKELQVKEYTIAKRDAFLRVFLSGIDVVKLVSPLWSAVQRMKDDGLLNVNISELAEPMKQTVIQLFAKDLTKIACLTLDCDENRKKVFPGELRIAVDEEHGYFYCPDFFSWVQDNLTMRQEQEILTTIIEVNDFVSLLKNYKALVLETVKSARVMNSNM